MTSDLIQRLSAAQSEEEKYWLLTDALLQQQPAAVAELALAVAVLRWFDLGLVRHFLPEADKPYAADWLEALRRLSFVELYPGERWNVHELTRQAILWHLWRDEPERYRAWSAAAAQFFTQSAEWPVAVEHLYHWAISEPYAAHQAFHDLAWDYQLHDNYLGWEALNAALADHRTHARLDPWFGARTRLSEAGLAAMQYRHADAQQHYRQALALYQQVQDRLGEAQCLLGLAAVEAFLNQHADAQQHYRQALALYQQVQDRLGEANCLKGLAAVAAFLKQHADAQQHYRQALALYQQVQSRLGEANCLLGLADVAAFLNQHADAQQHYRQALALYQQVQDRLGEANCLLGLADIHRDRGEAAEALGGYAQALPIYLDEVGDRQGAAECLLAWGEALMMVGDLDGAATRHAAAVEHAEATGDRWTRTQLWRLQGDILRQRGDLAAARAAYDEALALAATIAGTDWWVATVHARLQTLPPAAP